jgi:hypothetical protein
VVWDWVLEQEWFLYVARKDTPGEIGSVYSLNHKWTSLRPMLLSNCASAHNWVG